MLETDYKLLRVPPDILDEALLDFVRQSEMEDMTLPLPKFGWIACLNKEGYPIIGYIAGHHMFSTKVHIDIFVTATQFRSKKLGFNLMLSFLKDVKASGFTIIAGGLELDNTGIHKYYDEIGIPYTPYNKIEIYLEDAISKFENYANKK